MTDIEEPTTIPAGGLFPDAPAAAPTAPKTAGHARKEAAPNTRSRSRTGSPSSPKGGRPTKAASSDAELRRQLEETFTTIGLMVVALGGEGSAVTADGLAIIERAPKLADSLGLLAAQNPSVARVLSGTMTGSAWLAVAGAFGGLGFAIAANHNVLPPALTSAVAGPPATGGGGDLISAMGDLLAGLSPEELAELVKVGLAADAG